MIKRSFVQGLLLAILLVLPTAGVGAVAPTQAAFRIVRSDDQGMIIEVTTPHYTLQPLPGGLAVTAPGLILAPAPGAAALPLLTLPLRLPAAAPPQVSLLEATTVEVSLPLRLARQPVPLPSDITTLSLADPSPPRVAPPSDTPSGIEPPAPLALEHPQDLRGQTLALLRVAPFQIDWDRGTLRWHQLLRLAIRYDAAAAAPTTAAAPQDDVFAALLDRTAINPGLQTQAPATTQQGNPPLLDHPATITGSLKLLVERTGIYTVGAAQLKAAGWSPATIVPERLQLLRGSEEVPLEVSGQGDGLQLRFYGQPRTSRYQDAQVYWLFQGPTNGRRATPVPGPGTPLRWEENNLYASQHVGHGRDGWFARSLKRISGSDTLTATLVLPQASGAGTRLQIGLQGESITRHKLDVYASEQLVSRVAWDDSGATPGNATPITATLQLPALPAGGLTLRLSIPPEEQGDPPLDSVLVDWIGLPDVRIPEPAVALMPTILADTPSRLRVPGPGADYLIVSHASFLPELQPLVEYQRQRGLQVRLVDVQDIYDEFSGGGIDPEAIRAFTGYTLRAWQPAPRYLLLVGDGTSDYKNYLRKPPELHHNFIPPYLVDVDPWLGEISCDTCFARVTTPDGLIPDDPRSDLFPDLLVGRLPVSSAVQARAVVAKISAYGTSTPPGGWRVQHLFLADNASEADGTPDGAGDFFAASEQAISRLPRGALAQRFYYDPVLPDSQPRLSYAYADPSALRSSFLGAFDQGAAIITYFGHADYWQWGFTGPNIKPSFLWSLYDADTRQNGPRLPILLAMTCQTGIFQEPTEPALGSTDERLLTTAQGGIIASLSSSGNGIAHGHDLLYDGVIGTLYGPDPQARTVGAAQLAGFMLLHSKTSCCDDVLFSYQVFGDPATRLPLVPTQVLRLPITAR